MKISKKLLSASVILAFSAACYGALLMFLSGHIEFLRILQHNQTLSSRFWNDLNAFLQSGSLQKVGWLFLVLSAVIFLLVILLRKGFDEFERRIIGLGFTIGGLLCAILMPLGLITLLSDPNYAVETFLLLFTLQLLSLLLSHLVCLLRCLRD